MTLYEISEKITSLIDPETGDIADFDEFEKLVMEREDKIENLALWTINLASDIKAIREEEKRLAEKRRTLEKRRESIKRYLDTIQHGEAFKSARVSVTYRASEKVVIDDEDSFLEWAQANNDELLTYATPTANKTAIKEFLDAGNEINGVRIEKTSNIQIK